MKISKETLDKQLNDAKVLGVTLRSMSESIGINNAINSAMLDAMDASFTAITKFYSLFPDGMDSDLYASLTEVVSTSVILGSETAKATI